MKAPGEVPIIICCAEDDEPVLAKVLDELRREGLAPELVPGVELDSSLLTAAVDVAASDALFVLCTSAALDKGAVRRLIGLFSARSGPGQHIISTAFTPSRPLALLPAIRGALKEMRLTIARGGTSEQPPTSLLRDVVEAFVEPVPAQRPSPSRAQVPARDAPTSRAVPDARVDGPVDAPSRRQPAAPTTPVMPREEPRSNVVASPPVAASPSPVQPYRPPVAAVRSVDTAVPSEVDDDRGPSIEHRLSGVPAMPDSFVATDPQTSSARLKRLAATGGPAGRGPVFDEPRGNRMLLVFASVGIAGIVALALMQVLQPGESERSVPAVRGSGRSAPVEPSTTRVAPAASESPPREPTVAEPTVAAPAVAAPTVPAPTVAEPTTAEPDVPVPEPTVVAPVVEPEPLDGGGVPPAPAVVSKRDVDLAALALGLEERKLHRLGALWVTQETSEDNTWDDANRRCHGKRVNGVQGFRLPGSRELMKIRAAKLITTGTYWTREKRGTGDEALAIDASNGASNIYLTVEPSGRALCVRVL